MTTFCKFCVAFTRGFEFSTEVSHGKSKPVNHKPLTERHVTFLSLGPGLVFGSGELRTPGLANPCHLYTMISTVVCAFGFWLLRAEDTYR